VPTTDMAVIGYGPTGATAVEIPGYTNNLIAALSSSGHAWL